MRRLLCDFQYYKVAISFGHGEQSAQGRPAESRDYTIVDRQGQLLLERKKYPPDALTPIAPDLFLSSQGGTVQFTRSATGAVQGLLVTGARVQNVKLVRRSSSLDAR